MTSTPEPTAEDLLASTVVQDPFVDLTVRDLAVAAVLDTWSIGIAGLTEPAARSVRATLHESIGGLPVWRGPGRHTSADLALLHGTACHALDWDDYMHPMHGHCSSVLLPTAWSVALERNCTGSELMEAYIIGYQVNWLASLVLSHGHYRRGWHATSTIGVLGATAAAARLMGLTAPQCAAALGIAASMAGGLQVNFGSPVKALHAGLAARSAVQAAALAEAGMTAQRAWLTGTHGFLAVLGGDADPAAAHEIVRSAMDGPHGITTVMGLVQKPYTSCGCSHAAVDAVAGLTADLSVDAIERIEVHVDPSVTRTMRETLPTDSFTSRYSVSWVVAVAAADGTAGPQQFSADSISRPEVLRLRERVDVTTDLVVGDDERFAARVVVHTAQERREATVRHARGHPLNPMTTADRRTKQEQALGLVTDNPAALADLLATLPECEDLATLAVDIMR